jgi:hypothetical protein
MTEIFIIGVGPVGLPMGSNESGMVCDFGSYTNFRSLAAKVKVSGVAKHMDEVMLLAWRAFADIFTCTK